MKLIYCVFKDLLTLIPHTNDVSKTKISTRQFNENHLLTCILLE